MKQLLETEQVEKDLYLFSSGTPVSSTNKIGRHDIAEILLKVALNTIAPPGLVRVLQ
jgi:hypothetical protein